MRMRNNFLLVSLAVLVLLALEGCHKDALSGDWDLYTAMSANRSGTMSFTGGKFKQHIEPNAVTMGIAIDLKGSYKVDSTVLHLDPMEMGAGPDKSGTTGATTSNQQATPVDYFVEWAGPNVVYLTHAEGASKSVMAIARNGAKPDATRLSLTIVNNAAPGTPAQPANAMPTPVTVADMNAPTVPIAPATTDDGTQAQTKPDPNEASQVPQGNGSAAAGWGAPNAPVAQTEPPSVEGG